MALHRPKVLSVLLLGKSISVESPHAGQWKGIDFQLPLKASSLHWQLPGQLISNCVAVHLTRNTGWFPVWGEGRRNLHGQELKVDICIWTWNNHHDFSCRPPNKILHIISLYLWLLFISYVPYYTICLSYIALCHFLNSNQIHGIPGAWFLFINSTLPHNFIKGQFLN